MDMIVNKVKYSTITFDENEEILLNEYLEILKKQFCLATGKTEAEMKEVIEWFKGRDEIAEMFARFLTELEISGTYRFMQNAVEVGSVGKYNAISNNLAFSTVLSKYAFTIEKNHQFNGVLLPTETSVDILVQDEHNYTYPRINDFRTFILGNPTKEDSRTLEALKYISSLKPFTVVGVYGSKKDKDFKDKDEFIEKYNNVVRGYNMMSNSLFPTKVRLYSHEDKDLYAKAVITQKLVCEEVKPSIVQRAILAKRRY